MSNTYTLFKIDYEYGLDEWFHAAKKSKKCPPELRPLIHDSSVDEIGVPQSRADACEAWCESLPGWGDGPDHAENPILITEEDLPELPDGWTLYHASEAGRPDLHGQKNKQDGDWHYQPDDADSGEVWSSGFATPEQAVAAALEEIDATEIEESN